MTKAHSKGLPMKRIPSQQGEIIQREGAMVPAVDILESLDGEVKQGIGIRNISKSSVSMHSIY